MNDNAGTPGDAAATSSAPAAETATAPPSDRRIVRHAGVDRAVHWLAAMATLILLATAFLPILGINFAWVTIHWITGIVLLAVVLVHIVRVLVRGSLKSMWIGGQDLRDCGALARYSLRLGDTPPGKPGKYSLAQKLIHHLFALMVLTTLVTGVLMLMRIDTPWWRRNPYWFEESTWGVIYVLHGLAALCLVTMVIAHIYFALRPEKLHFTRAMIRGWISGDEYRRHHDPQRWRVEQKK
jgi:formate dehydrogenase subunit gamma